MTGAVPVITGTRVRGERNVMAKRPSRPAPDRFDHVPEDLARVGAHRAPARSGRGFVTFAWAALATGALVGAGVLGLQVIERGVSSPTAAASTAPAGPAPTVDPKAAVVVLNATTTSGLAAAASKTASADGWDVTGMANADRQDLTVSTVYYARDSQLGAALGLARSLGITRAPVKSDRFTVEGADRLTVVLGSDFAADA